MEREGLLPVGEILGVHGLKGALKVRFDGEATAPFAPGGRVFLKAPGAAPAPWTVVRFAPGPRGALLFLEGVTTREAAAVLTGAMLLIERAALPPLEEDTYYWADLIGLKVVTAEGVALGRLTAVMPTGGHDVYVVHDGRRESLIPALAAVVRSVDLAAGTMTVTLPEGLD
jgi:16S rRNA processing protein RimM